MFALLLLCVLMFLGCYAAGYLVLAFNYSPRYLRIVTIFGAGLLVGSALAIIIPEGIATVYSVRLANLPPHESIPPKSAAEVSGNHVEPTGKDVKQVGIDPDTKIIRLARDLEANNKKDESVHKDSEDSHAHADKSHNIIGLSLTMGFVFMFLVDQIGVGSCKIFARPLSMFCCCGKANTLPTSQDDMTSAAVATWDEHSARTTTLGLVIHSLADGIAIGAAFGLTLDLTLIIFVAIMLHKAPAAFGFTSFLMHERLPQYRVKVYLFVFALASPIGAILTYVSILINAFLTASPSGPSTTGTGYVLLVSGGTFLYVATAHILPHLTLDSSSTSTPLDQSSSKAAATPHAHTGSFTFLETAAFVFGSVVPVLISFGHSH